MKFSKAQKELLDAIRAGVKVHFLTGLNARYFRYDGKPIHFKTADFLLTHGLVEKYNEDWRGWILKERKK